MMLKRLVGARAARWGWLAATFGLGAGLLTSEWVHYRATAGAVVTLSRGQGEDLLEHVRQHVRDRVVTAQLADSLFLSMQVEGLRYIGLYEGGRLLAEAGDPVGPRVAGPVGGSDEIIDLGGRYRHFGMIPMTRTRPGPGDARPDSTMRSGPGGPGDRLRDGPARRDGSGRGGPQGGNRPPPPRGTLVVIEYEPVLARALAVDSWRAFLLSAAATAVLLAVAFGYWRLSVRHEAAQNRLEQQQRLGMLGEMSAVLAHEIRNPLASLKGHAQLLAERLGSDNADRRKADRIVTEAQRLESLTSDLLDFSRSGPIDIQPASPAAVLESSVQEVAPGGFVVSTGGAPDAWPFDSRRMQQALTNLLRNAQQASPPETPAVATVSQENGALVFTIRDFGPGIAQGDEKRIFSPFFTTRTSGTGLGLAVAQRVAEMHHGRISVANHPEGGAVFRITIPRN